MRETDHEGGTLLTKCPYEIFQPPFERRSGAGDVDALETAAACTEDGTVVEPEVCLVNDFVVERFVRETVRTEVEPEEVCSLGLDDFYLRQILCEVRLRILVVRLNVGEEFREPRRTVFVCGVRGRESERVRFVVTRFAAFRAETAAQLVILDENIGDLEPREVEGLARRGAGNGDRCGLGREGGERRMREPGADELFVYFVGDDEDTAAQSDLGDTLKLRVLPHAPDGVVRTAQDEELHVVLDDFLLKIRKVDLVASVLEPEGIVDECASVVADDVRERTAGGRRD